MIQDNNIISNHINVTNCNDLCTRVCFKKGSQIFDSNIDAYKNIVECAVEVIYKVILVCNNNIFIEYSLYFLPNNLPYLKENKTFNLKYIVGNIICTSMTGMGFITQNNNKYNIYKFDDNAAHMITTMNEKPIYFNIINNNYIVYTDHHKLHYYFNDKLIKNCYEVDCIIESNNENSVFYKSKDKLLKLIFKDSNDDNIDYDNNNNLLHINYEDDYDINFYNNNELYFYTTIFYQEKNKIMKQIQYHGELSYTRTGIFFKIDTNSMYNDVNYKMVHIKKNIINLLLCLKSCQLLKCINKYIIKNIFDNLYYCIKIL